MSKKRISIGDVIDVLGEKVTVTLLFRVDDAGNDTRIRVCKAGNSSHVAVLDLFVPNDYTEKPLLANYPNTIEWEDTT